MAKHYLLTAVLLAGAALGGQAQALIDEGFENTQGTSVTTVFPEGWSTVSDYTGPTDIYRWNVSHNSSSGSTMTGFYYAMIDAPTYDKGDNDGVGPRKDYLLTPAVTLNGTYQLQFDWEAAAYAVLSQDQYTFQVAVIDMANPSDTTVIFDIQNEQQVRDSGVPEDPYGTYIWQNWGVHTSKIPLDEYQGKQIKVAFIYDMHKLTGNVLYLDNVSIKKYQSSDGPIPELSQTSYTFAPMYVGEKFYSEVLTIKNVGKKGLKVTGWDCPEGMGLMIDTAGVDLNVNQTVSFNVYYSASFTSPVEGDVVIHTNGGDAVLAVKATKEAVPYGYTLENFEGAFPPAGWTNDGYGTYPYVIEGDKSAMSTGSLEDLYLTTPRLDLTAEDAPKNLVFTYMGYCFDTSEYWPSNDLSVQVSTNDGKTWSDDVWVSDYQQLDSLITVSVDLSAYATDSVRVRFKTLAVYYDQDEGADNYASYYIDRVLLPSVYGLDGVPMPTTAVTPADSATNVYNKQLRFEWNEAQFAEGYRFYLGKSTSAFDVVDGDDLGNVTSHTVAVVDNGTTYYWKVVPYNSVGDAQEVPVWVFTTQEDKTVRSLPWSENFDDDTFAPLGWMTTNGTYTKWTRTDYFPYNGKGSALATSNETEIETMLVSPDIEVPAQGEYTLSFWWGNDVPVALTRDDSEVHVNHTTADDGIDAVMFDIFADGEWTQQAIISGNKERDANGELVLDDSGDEIEYWCYESIDLTPYAGKTIGLRWRYVSHNYNRSRGGALDDVKIEAAAGNVALNVESWDAYKVNYNTRTASPAFALRNLGSQPVEVTSVKFGNSAYSTSLQAGTALEPASGASFNVYLQSAEQVTEPLAIADTLAIGLSDGNTIVMPLSAIQMPRDSKFYGFETDATGYLPEGFTGIDIDNSTTADIMFWTTPNLGSKHSFFVLNDSECYNSLKEPHGHQSLMNRCTDDGAFDDMIISGMLTATENSKFEFDARNWESTISVMPADAPYLYVGVSTTGPTRNSITRVATKKLELFDGENWTHVSVDLSAYAGQNIWVSLESQSSNCLGAFYDNFEYLHFSNFGLDGDLNGDGLIDSSDVTELISVILGNTTNAAADLNGDGAVDAQDVSDLVNKILGR